AMPRGSKPGERRGGRQRGVPNKKTALNNAALTAAASNPNVSPLEFLLAVMRDPNVSLDFRIKAAQVAAPFVHPKPGGLPASSKAGDGTFIDPADPTKFIHPEYGSPSPEADPLSAQIEAWKLAARGVIPGSSGK